MRRILYENPGIATFNLGDQIISDSIKKQLKPFFENDFIVEVSTRLPLNYYFGKRFKDFDYKFVLGSNILNPNRTFGYRKQWAISLFTTKMWGPAILVGAGWSTYSDYLSAGQKFLWKKVLHKTIQHSVRDRYTLEKMQQIGYSNVLYTGCPTMWCLSPKHCEQIPTHTSDEVVFTLTDYRQDHTQDKDFISALQKLYKQVYFWPQGILDMNYIRTLLDPDELSALSILPPSLESFDELLMENPNIEYIGTRLHGGIRALQKKRRALIISVDNRAKEINRDTGLPILERENIDLLETTVRGQIYYDLNINISAVTEWKDQFR